MKALKEAELAWGVCVREEEALKEKRKKLQGQVRSHAQKNNAQLGKEWNHFQRIHSALNSDSQIGLKKSTKMKCRLEGRTFVIFSATLFRNNSFRAEDTGR